MDFLALSWASLWPSAREFYAPQCSGRGQPSGFGLVYVTVWDCLSGTSDYGHFMCLEELFPSDMTIAGCNLEVCHSFGVFLMFHVLPLI